MSLQEEITHDGSPLCLQGLSDSLLKLDKGDFIEIPVEEVGPDHQLGMEQFVVTPILPSLDSDYVYAMIDSTIRIFSMLTGAQVTGPLLPLEEMTSRQSSSGNHNPLLSITMDTNHKHLLVAGPDRSEIHAYVITDNNTEGARRDLQNTFNRLGVLNEDEDASSPDQEEKGAGGGGEGDGTGSQGGAVSGFQTPTQTPKKPNRTLSHRRKRRQVQPKASRRESFMMRAPGT